MDRYIIRDREAGNIIDTGIPTYDDAVRIVQEYEQTDKQENTYTDNFYEIVSESEVSK